MNRMTKFALVQVIVIFATLSGCGLTQIGPYSQGDYCFRQAIDDAALIRALNANVECCKSFREMQFEVVENARQSVTSIPGQADSKVSELVREWPVLIGETSPVFSFREGRSRFVALDLRKYAGRVSSLKLAPGPTQRVAGSGVTAATASCAVPGPHLAVRIFRPIVSFLDSSLNQISAGERGVPSQAGVFPAWSFKVPEETSYIVIYSDESELGSPVKLYADTTTATVPVAGTPLFLPISIGGPKSGISVSTGQLAMYLE